MEDSKLVMTFKNILGNTFSITLDDPREDLEETEIVEAMNLIKEKNIFQPKGYDLVETVSAKVVNSTTTDYDWDCR